MADLLYYPYINLPKTGWTMRTLLYYDNIGSIVPQQYFYHPEENFDPFMLELVRQQLVSPIDPIEILDNPQSITAPFMELINRNISKLRANQRAFSKAGRNDLDPSNFVDTKIHFDKFDYEIFGNLMELGLAERAGGQWYSVERNTANHLMKFLATVISSKTNRLPVTDHIRSFTYSKTDQKVQQKRETILKTLIPYPETFELNDLFRFKERHAGLANNFRNRVEQIVLDPNIMEGTALFHYKMAEMIDCKEELVARMKETGSFENIFFGSVLGLISGGASLLDPNAFSVVGALAGFGQAVYSALRRERAENVIDQSGLKYLALADYKLGNLRE
ncbi:hypothetical protein D3C87_98800 [compost metagenome]